MSHTKKNKGRDPEARKSDGPINRLVTKFLEMPEPDYARSVVIPVLEAEGYQRIDFHHGNTEVGKDLIFFRDNGFDNRALVVAVVKTDKVSKTSSDSSGLPVILVQVHQALKNEVLSWDGTKKRPDEVLVILADDPSHDLLSSSPDGFRECCEAGARFIHGSVIAERLFRNRLDIAEQLLQSKLDASQYLQSNPTNLPLLNALNSSELVDIATIYTDLDASVGTTTVSDALCLIPSPNLATIRVAEVGWPAAAAAIRGLEGLLGSVLRHSLSDAEETFSAKNALAKTQANKALWKDIDTNASDIDQWIQAVDQEFGARALSLNSALAKVGRKEHKAKAAISAAYDLATDIKIGSSSVADAAVALRRGADVCGDMAKVCACLQEFRTALHDSTTELDELDTGIMLSSGPDSIGELRTAMGREVANARDFLTRSERLRTRSGRYVSLQDYELSVDVAKLAERLRGYVEALVARFHSPCVVTDREFSRALLADTRRYLFVIDDFKRVPALSAVFTQSPESHIGDRRLGACVLGLLNSGVDVLVTGNAGSGKSTTLEMFARKRAAERELNEEIVFLPLARLGEFNVSATYGKPSNLLCEEIARLFRPGQPGVTSKFVRERLDSAKKLVLVVDGIDEAASWTDWLARLITELRGNSGTAFQVVASSRFGVPELAGLELFNLVLLPFSRDQVIRFIRDFLKGEPVLAEEVIAHLEANPNLFSVAQTPLMSTILCVLASSGVTLPETKSALYRERFELLWGAYDAKKQVRRVKSSRSSLEDVSKKVAFFLHSRRRRSAPREDIVEYTIQALSRKYRRKVVIDAVKELERPCNVLVSDLDGALGFGHLSYQEYLAADELYTSRQGEIVNHLADPWWRGALVLAAMRADDIGTLLADRVLQVGGIGKAAETLSAMIEVCDDSQKAILRRLLKDQKLLDRMVETDGLEMEPDY
jgi:hypothetical protein